MNNATKTQNSFYFRPLLKIGIFLAILWNLVACSTTGYVKQTNKVIPYAPSARFAAYE